MHERIDEFSYSLDVYSNLCDIKTDGPHLLVVVVGFCPYMGISGFKDFVRNNYNNDTFGLEKVGSKRL